MRGRRIELFIRKFPEDLGYGGGGFEREDTNILTTFIVGSVVF